MKRIFASILAIAVISAAFTGCTNGDNGSDNSGSSSQQSGSDSSDNSDNSGSSSQQSGNLDNAERTAADLANAASSCLEWVSMQEITDPENAMTMFGIDASLCDDFYFSVAMMSAHLNEIIIVKPKPGSEPKVRAQLDEHFDYIKNSAAFYPSQELSAEGAVQGKTDDGYYYIIVHEIGSQIADVIKDYNPGDEIPRLEQPDGEQ